METEENTTEDRQAIQKRWAEEDAKKAKEERERKRNQDPYEEPEDGNHSHYLHLASGRVVRWRTPDEYSPEYPVYPTEIDGERVISVHNA